MPLRAPDTTEGPFREQDTPLLSAIVKDNLGAFIPGAALDNMTLTLYAEETLEIINSRDRVDVKALVSNVGAFAFQFTQEDMVMVNTDKLEEYHRLLIEWEWGGTKRGSWEIRIRVQNEEKVPVV